jgi:hypothetical protein
MPLVRPGQPQHAQHLAAQPLAAVTQGDQVLVAQYQIEFEDDYSGIESIHAQLLPIMAC